MPDEEYYLRDLTANDWSEFKKMDDEAFDGEGQKEQWFIRGLSTPKSLSLVMVHKETKEFMGYYRVVLYGTLGYIQRIGVKPKFQGKGYGGILMESAMSNLEKAGATKYILYVLTDNETAINLYKKYHFQVEFSTTQFEIPFTVLPKKPRGTCRHMDWGEIQLMSLRFGLNPYQIQSFFGQENQHVLVLTALGQQLGVCRFNPDFPGAFPFKIRDKEYALDFIAHLVTFITNKEFEAVKITFDSQPELVNFLLEHKIPIKSKLYRMSSVVKL